MKGRAGRRFITTCQILKNNAKCYQIRFLAVKDFYSKTCFKEKFYLNLFFEKKKTMLFRFKHAKIS